MRRVYRNATIEGIATLPGLIRCIAVTVLLTVVLGDAVAAAEPVQAIEAAKREFMQATAGDKRAVRRAMQQFRGLQQQQPDNPVIDAYLAACLALKGRDADIGPEKMRYTGDAVQRLDQVLRQIDVRPVDPMRMLETKLVAANTFINIPTGFNRREQGHRLLNEILAQAEFARLPPGMRTSVYLSAATAAEQRGDRTLMRRHLEAAIAQDPKGPDAARARARLSAP